MLRWFACIFLTALVAHGQEREINWGLPQRKHDVVSAIYPQKDADLFVQQLSGNGFLQSHKLTHYKNGVKIISKRISERFENAVVLLEDIVYFQDKLLAFFSDKKDGNNMLYLQQFDQEIDPINEPKVISMYPLPKNWGDKGHFSIQLSQNKNFMVVEYIIPAKRDGFNRFGYRIFDKNIQVVQDGEYELPIAANKCSVDIRHLSNNGAYFIGATLFNTSNSARWMNSSAIDGAEIYQVKNDSLVAFHVQFENERIVDFQLASDSTALIITGTYGSKVNRTTNGIFLQRFGLVDGKEGALFVQPFDEISNWRRDRSDRQGAGWVKGNSDGFINYAFRNVMLLPSGEVIVVAEEYSIYQQISGDVKGLSQTVFHYYYDDILVFCMDTTGKLKWSQTVAKEQHSTNDYGYYSSFTLAQFDQHVVLFFNDNIRNYGEDLRFEEFQATTVFPARKKNIVLASCEIDLNTGNCNRMIQNTYVQSNGTVVPRLSEINLAYKQLVFYSVGRKEQYGWMQF